MKKKNTLVVIDRKKWYRGMGTDFSALLGTKEQGHRKMCCLGFACLAIGLKKSQISGKTYPNAVGFDICGLTEHGRNASFSTKAADINDDDLIPDAVREKTLRLLAKDHGFTFRFVN